MASSRSHNGGLRLPLFDSPWSMGSRVLVEPSGGPGLAAFIHQFCLFRVTPTPAELVENICPLPPSDCNVTVWCCPRLTVAASKSSRLDSHGPREAGVGWNKIVPRDQIPAQRLMEKAKPFWMIRFGGPAGSGSGSTFRSPGLAQRRRRRRGRFLADAFNLTHSLKRDP